MHLGKIVAVVYFRLPFLELLGTHRPLFVKKLNYCQIVTDFLISDNVDFQNCRV